ncbi:MAG: ABC transporter ATP-binding component [Candidatus Scalindua brodae]|uniref:ABC transporter ATP-binding component n=1 Tax=Candidatus Scalindua brodae TaxID=237368 RepID=A0A0B0EBD4_9BACT|nr:MAG: ABC transporter ATP-binding component [Candidatus Scalindua brodae]
MTEALGGVNLSIEKGDFTAIAGPSGSGKSTLLNLIGALDSPTRGSIFYENIDITKIPLNKLALFRLEEIGYVFQAYNLINTLTAIENVEYVMLLQGISNQIRRKKSIEILKRVGLEPYIHRFPNEMSGGQQQRVAVARAIVAEPKVVMADEPTANLDSKTAENLLDLMKELNEEKGITFVFSTHDQMIMSKARKLILLKDGKIAT